MVISFEEKDRATIEANGMTIIEFKLSLYKLSEIAVNAWEVKDFIEEIEKAWETFKTRFTEAIDNVRYIVESTTEEWHYRTSMRYRIVKVFSKCTGIEKLKLWKMTRHTYLARSCC